MAVKYIPGLDLHRREPAIELIRTLDSVSRHGGVSNASRKLGIPEQTIRDKITDLEERAGGKVHKKYKKEFTLTNLGRELIERHINEGQ